MTLHSIVVIKLCVRLNPHLKACQNLKLLVFIYNKVVRKKIPFFILAILIVAMISSI